jgi:transketolase
MLPGASSAKREGVLRGGYVLVRESAPLDTILIGTGSEVQHAVAAARELGPGTRVVSLPCFSRFERQPADYQEVVLPSACERRVSIEAGVTFGWRTFVGTRGRMVGIDRFGASAPGNRVMEELGMTEAAVVAAARAL